MKIATTKPGTPLPSVVEMTSWAGDRDPRHGADDAPVDERPPVHLVAVDVHLLLHEPEEDHRCVRPEQGDQGDELADPGEHRDEHDHERRAD